MLISIVVAIGNNREIGAAGNLLWHLPKDMAFFKETTIGHHVLMGRKTYESIPEKYRPLKGRVNIVVSNTTEFEDTVTVATIQQGIDFARQNGEDELMIIGGGSVYQETIQSADILYVTAVLGDFPEADTFFPEIDTAIWQLVEIADAPADDKNTFAMRFCRYERRK